MGNIWEEFHTYKLDFGVVDIDRGFELVGTVRGIVVVGKVVGGGIVKNIVCNMANWVGGSEMFELLDISPSPLSPVSKLTYEDGG